MTEPEESVEDLYEQARTALKQSLLPIAQEHGVDVDVLADLMVEKVRDPAAFEAKMKAAGAEPPTQNKRLQDAFARLMAQRRNQT